MDVLGPIIGPGAGASVVGLIWALAHALRRRSEAVAERAKADAALVLAEAQTESAAAGAVVELLNQLREMRKDLDRKAVAITQLSERVDGMADELAEERSRREYWQQRFYAEMEEHTATKAAAIKLREEWERDKARPSVKSERPGPGSQRKS